jgi:hypothetical protein
MALVDPDPFRELGHMVVKQGVGLGLLSPAKRNLALAVGWACLPDGLGCDEREVNTLIKACLNDACQFLSTDHVELRRWLVDAGWLARDGFGRRYTKVLAPDLPVACADAARTMQSLGDVRVWCQRRREHAFAARKQARDAWTLGQLTPP